MYPASRKVINSFLKWLFKIKRRTESSPNSQLCIILGIKKTVNYKIFGKYNVWMLLTLLSLIWIYRMTLRSYKEATQ